MKNKWILLGLLPALLFTGCSSNNTPAEEEEEIVKTSFVLNYSVVELEPGDTLTLAPKIYNSDEGLSWVSSNSKVASVDANGLVTALEEGTATIYAYDSLSIGQCVISVSKDMSAPVIKLSKEEVVIGVDDYYTITAELYYRDQKIDNASFTVTLIEESSSGILEYAIEDSGYRFHALNAGTATYGFSTTYNDMKVASNVTFTVK